MSWGPKSLVYRFHAPTIGQMTCTNTAHNTAPVHCFAWLKPIRLRSLTTQQLQIHSNIEDQNYMVSKNCTGLLFFKNMMPADASRCRSLQHFWVCYAYPDSLRICILLQRWRPSEHGLGMAWGDLWTRRLWCNLLIRYRIRTIYSLKATHQL